MTSCFYYPGIESYMLTTIRYTLPRHLTIVWALPDADRIFGIFRTGPVEEPERERL